MNAVQKGPENIAEMAEIWERTKRISNWYNYVEHFCEKM